jgi:hypothetical protein
MEAGMGNRDAIRSIIMNTACVFRNLGASDIEWNIPFSSGISYIILTYRKTD